MKRPRAGFTLLELLVILSIVSVLMTMMMATIDTRRFQLDTATKEIRSALVAARGKALLKQHDVVLTFDATASHVLVLEDLDNSGSMDSGEPRRMVELSEDVRFHRGGAAALNDATDAISLTKRSGGLPALTFHRNGAASEEGTIYLTSARAAATGDAFSQDTRALTVDRATGRVHCLTYRTGSWQEGC